MKFDDHENNVELSKAIYEIISCNCVCVCSSNKSSVNSLISCIFNKFSGMSKNEILEVFERKGGCPKEFHKIEDIVFFVNMNVNGVFVYDEDIEKARIKDITGVKSFTVCDYCLRFGDKCILVHDYGVDRELEISVS